MKDFMFVTWLYFQILLVDCDIFVNNLNGSDMSLKMCIKKTINHLFSENDTLNLILNSDLCEDAIFEMNPMRPYIVLNMTLNMNATNGVKFQYDGQFIICSECIESLNFEIGHVNHIVEQNKRSMGNSKVLVITMTAHVSDMFEMLWFYGINNVIILVYGQGTMKLFKCNRFAPENECGDTAKLMVHQECDEQLSLSFTNEIHQMNKCPVTFAHRRSINPEFEKKHPSLLAVMYIARELSNRVNATFNSDLFIDDYKLYYASKVPTKIVISATTLDEVYYFTPTQPLLSTHFVWLVPKAKQISNMNVFVKIFNYDVWIATSVVFILGWLTWFLIISRNGGFTFDKLCLSFLNVWSLTIFGNVARVPRSLALRIFILFYLFYAINMQFAFTSDMSTVLTAPQYEFQIRNLEELANSQLPMYIEYSYKKGHFGKNNTDRKLYTKLQNSMHGIIINQVIDLLPNLHIHGNYGVIISAYDLRTFEIFFNNEEKIDAYEIRDDLMLGVQRMRLQLLADHYFTTTLNTFISRMIESGILDKRKNDFYHQLGFHTEKVDKMSEDDAISLKHITFIFVFLGFGFCTACVVFCFELVLNKYL